MLTTFLTDAVLVAEVSHLLNTAEEALRDKQVEMDRNVLDPFAAMFEMAGFGLSHDAWVRSELMRQAQKSLQNQVGDFHQSILGSMEGWENLNTGSVVDLVSHPRKIIAEVKNKHNTLTGGKRSDQYHNFEKLVMQKASRYRGYTAYLVTVIPKEPARFDLTFTPSDKETGTRCPENALIREIDGASFYDLASGEKDTLSRLFKILPEVIKGISGENISEDGKAALAAYFSMAFGR